MIAGSIDESPLLCVGCMIQYRIFPANIYKIEQFSSFVFKVCNKVFISYFVVKNWQELFIFLPDAHYLGVKICCIFQIQETGHSTIYGKALHKTTETDITRMPYCKNNF